MSLARRRTQSSPSSSCSPRPSSCCFYCQNAKQRESNPQQQHNEEKSSSSSTAANAAPCIAIIGGGFAGLALASLLSSSSKNNKCNDVNYTIFESIPSADNRIEVSGTVQIPNGKDVFSKIELLGASAWDTLLQQQQQQQQQQQVDEREKDGEEYEEENAVSRANLRNVLLNCIPDEHILYGRRVVHIASCSCDNNNDRTTTDHAANKLFVVSSLKQIYQQRRINKNGIGGKAEEEDEIMGPFDIIVGADGITSNVRKLILSSSSSSSSKKSSSPTNNAWKKQVALVGDARWAEGYGKSFFKRGGYGYEKPWYDLLGLTRLSSGLNVALQDGVQLGELLMLSSSNETQNSFNDSDKRIDLGKFCAATISNDILWYKRARLVLQVIILCLVIYYKQSRSLVV